MNEKNIKVFDVKTGCQKMLLYYCFYCNQRKGITCVLVMECEACEKTFTRKANLKRHEEKCQGVFKCEECDLKPCKITAKIRGNMFINQSSGLSIYQLVYQSTNMLISHQVYHQVIDHPVFLSIIWFVNPSSNLPINHPVF